MRRYQVRYSSVSAGRWPVIQPVKRCRVVVPPPVCTGLSTLTEQAIDCYDIPFFIHAGSLSIISAILLLPMSRTFRCNRLGIQIVMLAVSSPGNIFGRPVILCFGTLYSPLGIRSSYTYNIGFIHQNINHFIYFHFSLKNY